MEDRFGACGPLKCHDWKLPKYRTKIAVDPQKKVSERFAGTPRHIRHLSAVCFLVMAAALVRPGQPWHVGERQLQLQQKTVASSDEMGPHIYHKVGFGVGFGNLVDADLRSCVAIYI